MKIAHINRSIILFFLALPFVLAIPAWSMDDDKNGGRIDDEAVHKRYIIYTEEKRTPVNLLLPMNFYFNSAFDSAQVPTAFKQSGYFKRYGTILDDLVHIPRSIREGGGFRKFLIDEWTSARAVPNYTLHIFGGGYDFRMIAEFYKYNGVPAPYLFSFITCYAGHISNEALENSNKKLTPHDHLADLLFFDWVGKVMFLSDDVAGFFHDTLRMRNWMGQPMFDVRKKRIYNAACNYVLLPYIYQNKVRFFFFMGYHYIAGFSFRVNDADFLTLSAGVAVMKGFDPNRDSTKSSVKKFRTCGGIFYDRNGSLLASLILNGTENYKLRLNIYPDLLNVDHVNFGLFLGVDDYNRVAVGITMYTLIGLAATF
jgi:hypothetical protein